MPDAPNPDFAAWAREGQKRVEEALERLLPAATLAPTRLHEAMRYACLGGGKRVRPLLVYAAGQVVGGSPDALDRAAIAVEAIHAYSLVHDDLPCMDDDVLRRGRPTCHVRYDEATAMLVGDALQSFAFEMLAEIDVPAGPAVVVEMIRTLAQAAGSRGMAGGQAIDLAAVGRTLTLPELEMLHIHKTGALIRASIVLGASCGAERSADQVAALQAFAKAAGLAFQVVDDILDSDGDPAELGKTPGKDARANKPTYVTCLGLSEARQHARELHDQALRALDPLGARARRLRELADFIVLRRH
jgi:farnesyl diphosphate synthase